MKTNVRNFTDSELLKRMSELDGFKGYPEGHFCIYVRSDEDEYDVFDDKRYTFYYDSNLAKPIFCRVDSCTTNTGSYGLFNFSKWNKLGAAVLQSNHIVYDAFVLGYSKGRKAYRENKAWGHYRDNNKNKKAEEIGKLYYTKIYAHIHGVKSRFNIINKIYNWSTACLVDNNTPRYNSWLKLLNGQKYLTVAIIKES